MSVIMDIAIRQPCIERCVTMTCVTMSSLHSKSITVEKHRPRGLFIKHLETNIETIARQYYCPIIMHHCDYMSLTNAKISVAYTCGSRYTILLLQYLCTV